jgi:hypothetical protein
MSSFGGNLGPVEYKQMTIKHDLYKEPTLRHHTGTPSIHPKNRNERTFQLSMPHILQKKGKTN